jgi:hypothetical protein
VARPKQVLGSDYFRTPQVSAPFVGTFQLLGSHPVNFLQTFALENLRIGATQLVRSHPSKFCQTILPNNYFFANGKHFGSIFTEKTPVSKLLRSRHNLVGTLEL